MRLKTSFFNKGVLLNDFKRFSWIGAGYLLILLFSVPLQVFMRYSALEDNGINNEYFLSQIFQFDINQSFLHIMSLIIVPVLAGLLLFRYIQDSRAGDMIHALPVRRNVLYRTHILSGIILLYLPVILTALISWALVAALGVENIKSTDILDWLLISLLFNLLFFMCSVAVGMITGMTALQGVLSYILLLLPSGLSLLLVHNISKHIYGFAYDYYFDKIGKLSPLVRLTEIPTHPLQAAEITVYLLSCIALFFAGAYLYRRRHLEMAGNAIVFNILRPIFKYSVTFCGMLLLGSYFNSGLDSPGWTYFGYFLGSLLAYFLTEILLNKSLQVFQRRSIRDYGIYVLVVIVLCGVLHYDLTGYERRLPDLSKVKSIYMDNFFYALNYVPNVNAQRYGDYNLPPVKAVHTEKDNLAAIYSLHQEIVANLPAEKKFLSTKPSREYPQKICLAYEMQNGRHVYRQYEIDRTDYADSLKPIYESREYKELHNRIFSVNSADVELIEINVYEAGKNVRLVDPVLISQAVEALRRDAYNETYEDMVDMRAPWAGITVYTKNNYHVGLSWKKTYVNFENWLIETGKYNQARLLPGEDIACAYVDNKPEFNNRGPDKQELEKRPGILKTADPEKLELCLQNYGTDIRKAAYKVFFLLNNGNIIYGFFSEADAPAFVKQHFVP